MVNEQIVSYIKNQTAQGISREVIKQALLVKGWAEQDVEDAFYSLENSSGAVPSPYVPLDEKEKIGKNKWAVISLACGIISLILMFTFPSLLNYLLMIVGIVSGFIGLGSKKRTIAVFGLVLNFISIFLVILGVILLVNGYKSPSV